MLIKALGTGPGHQEAVAHYCCWCHHDYHHTPSSCTNCEETRPKPFDTIPVAKPTQADLPGAPSKEVLPLVGEQASDKACVWVEQTTLVQTVP